MDPSPFCREVHQLELRLRGLWAGQRPVLSSLLHNYQSDWEEQFQAPSQPREWADWDQRLDPDQPLLVSDYHPLRRSVRMLQSLLEERLSGKPIGVVFELLEQCEPMPASTALSNPELCLQDGVPLRVAYSSLLHTLGRAGAWIAGAWCTGSPPQRDRAAARQWSHLQRSMPGYQQVWFFGDWHLADAHLPQQIRAHGGDPLVLHQSPEPLWDQLTSWPPAELLQLGNDHWAWMHTPPLAQWASELQTSADQDPAEAAATLAESLAVPMSDLLELAAPAPMDCMSVDHWHGFRALLPTDMAAAFPAGPPRHLLVHPQQALAWLPGPLSPNQLVELAAHSLTLDHPVAARTDPAAAVVRRSFALLWALALNPFLVLPSPQALRDRYRPSTALEGVAPGPALARFLLREGLANTAAATLSQDPELDPAGVRELLESGPQAFFWERANSTIRASSRSA